MTNAANWDGDNTDKPFESWRIINHNFYKHVYIKILLDLKDIPIIGSLCKNAVFNHISHAYDVCSTYVEALEKVEHVT